MANRAGRTAREQELACVWVKQEHSIKNSRRGRQGQMGIGQSIVPVACVCVYICAHVCLCVCM